MPDRNQLLFPRRGDHNDRQEPRDVIYENFGIIKFCFVLFWFCYKSIRERTGSHTMLNCFFDVCADSEGTWIRDRAT